MTIKSDLSAVLGRRYEKSKPEEDKLRCTTLGYAEAYVRAMHYGSACASFILYSFSINGGNYKLYESTRN